MSLKYITPSELKLLINNNPESVLVIDVREKHEYEESHVQNAISLPVGNLESSINLCQISKPEELVNKKIVLYCKGGLRAEKALRILEQKNYENLFLLEGNINAWLEL